MQSMLCPRRRPSGHVLPGRYLRRSSEVPQTWEDVYEIIPILQRNHMEFGLTGLTGGSMPNLNTFLMFLYQMGVAVFKEDSFATNLDSRAVAFTFKKLTEVLYAVQHALRVQHLPNRFRLGELPLGHY